MQFILGYVDPGTGSLVLQLLIAGLLSAGVVFGRARDHIFGVLARLLRRPKPVETEIGPTS